MASDLYYIWYTPKDFPNHFQIFSGSIRQYFVNHYPPPFFHNHRLDGKSIYRSRGAPIQFKVINNEICILSLPNDLEHEENSRLSRMTLHNQWKHFTKK